MKKILFFLGLFLLCCVMTLTAKEGFAFDIARFFWTAEISEVEIPFAVPYSMLSYITENDTTMAPFKVIIVFENLDSDDALHDTIDLVSIVPSLDEAKERNLVALEQFKAFFKPGHYRMTINVIDKNTGKKTTESEIFSIDPLQKDLTLSDIKLATSIESDTAEGQFTKNGLRIIPNPSRMYGLNREQLFYYVEIYNLEPDYNKYDILYTILDAESTVVNSFDPKKKMKGEKGAVGIDVGAFNLVAFKPGEYSLLIEVNDGEATASRLKRFRVYKAPAIVEEKSSYFTEEELEYYKRIEYIASSSEFSEYKSYADTGKVAFLKRFWAKRDSDPSTEVNEGLQEFIRRVKYVEAQFATPFKSGYDTDRGRIYVKYGPPDSEERHQFESDYKPYEIWDYYSYGGYKFIFSDMGGDGEFSLIYSSTPREPSLPNWEKHVPDDVGIMHGK
jgi:GWxTD domain-containing protein